MKLITCAGAELMVLLRYGKVPSLSWMDPHAVIWPETIIMMAPLRIRIERWRARHWQIVSVPRVLPNRLLLP